MKMGLASPSSLHGLTYVRQRYNDDHSVARPSFLFCMQIKTRLQTSVGFFCSYDGDDDLAILDSGWC
jgi:hypothetical protein